MTKIIIIPDFKYKSLKQRGRGTGHQGPAGSKLLGCGQ